VPKYTDRKGEHRLRSNVDDLLSLYTLLDVNKVNIPQFVAADPDRLPPSGQVGGDISMLTALVYELRDQVAALAKKLNEPSSTVTSVECVSSTGSVTSKESLPSIPPSIGFCTSGADMANGTSFPAVGRSWAAVAAHPVATSDNRAMNYQQPTRVKPAVKRGKRPANGKIKAIPRALTCFVGRLESSTTEQDLKDYLVEVGILDVTCRKLEPKDGRVFKTAAFRVSCPEEYRDRFYDESVASQPYNEGGQSPGAPEVQRAPTHFN